MVVAEAGLEAKPKSKLYTPDEYLALEEVADVRHEYRNGEILAMASNLPQHNQMDEKIR